MGVVDDEDSELSAAMLTRLLVFRPLAAAILERLGADDFMLGLLADLFEHSSFALVAVTAIVTVEGVWTEL